MYIQPVSHEVEDLDTVYLPLTYYNYCSISSRAIIND